MNERRSGHGIEEKREKYTELCGGKPEAIFVLSSGIVEKSKGQYRSGSYAVRDNKGFLSGGKARSIAAAEIAQVFTEAPVITMSKTAVHEPSQASVMAAEIQSKGIDKSRFVQLEQSHDTFSELLEIIKLIIERNWRHVVVVNNEFQIPRAELMLAQLSTLFESNESKFPEFKQAVSEYKLRKGQIKIVFVPAEQVLPFRRGVYGGLIKKVKESAMWQERVEKENKGVEDLEEGNYKLSERPK